MRNVNKSSEIIAQIILGLIAITGMFGLIFVFSAIGGFLVMLMWPFVMRNTLPGFVESGMIASHISFWTSYWMVFMFGILFRASSSKKTNNKER